jgi:hypothetical protein
MLGKIRNAALEVAFLGGRCQHPCVNACKDLSVLAEPESCTIKLEDTHNALPLEDAIFQVPVLLAVQISLALWRKLIEHVLRKSLQICLQVPRARLN